ncbi:putative 26S proteasome regulatory subunit rpn6 [Yarrowia sp. C11]|nr:putative 26S proteasome regulatory subunit rpn6 [Yarrowia sp. E02]KAG5369272.1 putative 26S proteasome regulatory subunit rpn6 [Yarrowia sp. C11]
MTLEETLASAKTAEEKGNLAEAEKLYREILDQKASNNEKSIQIQETALINLGTLYASNNKPQDLADLIHTSLTVMSGFAKSKTAKIIRNLIDLFAKVPSDCIDLQIATTQKCIDWAVSEKRNFLRQSLQTRLVSLFLEKKTYYDALNLINTLLKELKKLDDKMVLVEVQLLEAKAYHALRNIPKSRASLTSARTSANAVYCPPLTQAALDTMSGILQADDKDYKTAFSYFYEAFEGYVGQENPKAGTVLKYMLLCKIMLNLADDVETILNNKSAQAYQGRDVDVMKAVAVAYANRSLKEFEHVLELYKEEVQADPVIRVHFNDLYDSLLEQNLLKVIEPFSCVEINHIAEIIGLDTRQVEGKLSQMILDKGIKGVLDQGNGWLFIYDEPQTDKTYDSALETVKHMSTVVDLLYEKASSLN